MGAQMVKEVASKTSDVAGDGTTTATVLAQAIYREGAKNVTAGANPMAIKRGIDKAVEAIDGVAQGEVQAGHRPDDRPGRHDLGEPRRDHRPDHRRSDGQGRQGRRHHRRGGEELETSLDVVEGHAVRPRLSLAVFRDRSRAHGSGARESGDSHPREEDQLDEGPAAGAGAGGARRPSAADHRRGHRRRGAGDARRQQAARHAPGGRGEGARLRRSPEGDARRRRHPDQRQGRDRGPRHQARDRHAGRPRPGEEGHHRQGQHDDHRGRRAARRRSRAASSSCARRSRTRPPTTTARSCRSGSPSWSAAWRSSRSARRPRPR